MPVEGRELKEIVGGFKINTKEEGETTEILKPNLVRWQVARLLTYMDFFLGYNLKAL